MRVLQQDWVAKWAVYSPDKIAIKEYETSRTLTYYDLNRLSNRLSHYLTEDLQICKGDRIAILAENCLEYIILFSAAQKTGIILVPLNYRLTSSEIEFMLTDAEPVLTLVEEKFISLLPPTSAGKIRPSLKIKDIEVLCDVQQHIAKDLSYQVNPVEDDDAIFILYTSGTTGFPKGALYTHKMMFWNSVNTSMALIMDTESRTINCMPPFHTGGWNVLTTPFLHHGGFTCLIKKFDPETVLHLMQEERVTIFMGVPTMLKMLTDHDAFQDAHFRDLYYLIVGGAPMPIPLIEIWDKKGVAVRQGYGMTEVGPNLTSLHQRDAIRKKGSIGFPNYYVDIKLIDASGNEVETGKPGELLIKGPMVSPGYWRSPEASEKALQEGWFHTGDMALQDEEGYLYIVDRIKNMFISGGENVYPAEVEKVFESHAYISETVVIGVPDPVWGEVGKAFVVLRSDTQISAEELLEYCRGKLARFKVPKYIVFLETLPLNAAGKVDRVFLK